jgi:hypothetical protein
VQNDGTAISYKLLERGTPIHARDGAPLGTVEAVLENEREHIFDGIVMRTDAGRLFVDAPEVACISDLRVTLTIDASEAAELPPYARGAPEYRAHVRSGPLGRLLGGAWKRR